jgi:nucleotide-binding universal stress UspA family protein
MLQSEGKPWGEIRLAPLNRERREAMYKKILLPTDGSPLSNAAIEQGVALAKSLGAKVVGMTVSAPFHIFALEPMMVSDTKETYKKDCEEMAAKYLGAVTSAAGAAGVPCEVAHVNADHPYEGIIVTAKSMGCDLIFMASHGRKGASALVLGSETVKVLTHSKIPVLVCR